MNTVKTNKVIKLRKRINWILIMSLLLFSISFAFRLFYLDKIEGVSGGDAYNNLLITQKIAKLENPFVGRRLPFYSMLLVPGHIILNLDPIYWSRFISALAASLVVVAVFILTLRLNLGFGTGILASILTGFSPPFLFISLRPLSNSVFALLVIISLLVLYLPKTSNKKILLGLLLGLASMTRHEGFLVAGVIFFSVYLLEGKNFLKKSLKMMISFLLVILPFFINNLVVYKNIFYTDYLENSAGLYIPGNLNDLLSNLNRLLLVIQNLWFGKFDLLLQKGFMFFFILGLFLLARKLGRKALPFLLVVLLQLLLLLWFQPSARYFQHITPFLSIVVSYGLFGLFKKKRFMAGVIAIGVSIILISSTHISISKNIVSHNRGTKNEYFLRLATLFVKGLDGAVGFAADFPLAVYFMGDRGVYFTARPPRIETKETQLTWLRENNVKYFVWNSKHDYFNFFTKESDLYKEVYSLGDNEVSVKIYVIEKYN